MDRTRTDARAFEVHIPLTAKTYDVDVSGVVSHLTFLRWIEDLRLQMLIEHPPLQWQVDAGGVPVVARTAVHYREPVGIGQMLQGSLWVSRVGRSRWNLAAEFRVRGRLVAEASQSGCFLDRDTRRPLALRPEIRDRLRPAPAVRETGAPCVGVRPAGRRGWRELMEAGSGSLASRR
ncbi:MAG: acyl-CoA thioesterase [Gammaproteobacteria bacterium]|jgi:acyl-CoA thioester hydrolase|nr:acyl-CoA thioesterase [Gammaproteobacteria bacterium]